MRWIHRHNQQNNVEKDKSEDFLPKEEQGENPVVRKRKKTQRMVVVLLLLVSVFLMLSYAWYYYQSHRKVNSDEREVMPPYCLYLLEPNGRDTLQLTVGNLHPGETKQIVVGVSNRAPEGEAGSGFVISRDSKFNYELELAYTKNLPVDYQVYELTKVEGSRTNDSHVTVEWTDTQHNVVSQCFEKKPLNKTGNSQTVTDANNSEMYGDATGVVNLGQYDIYDKSSGATFDLTTKVDESGNVEFDLDYYLIEIQWNDGISFSDYLKETDLVYVMVKALQLEPEEAAQ